MNALLRRLSLAVLLSFVCIGSLALDAAAQPTKDITTRARESVTKGLAAQAAGRFDEAITAYNEAYALLPHPELLFNLGQAYRLKGDRVTALDFYRKYVAIQPDGRGAKEAVEWTAQIERRMREEAAAEEARRAEAARQGEVAHQAEAARQAEARSAEEAGENKAIQAKEQNAPTKSAPGTAPSGHSGARDRRLSKEKIAAMAIGVAGATVVGVGFYFRDQSHEKYAAVADDLRYSSVYAAYQGQVDLRQARRYGSYEDNLLLVGSSALLIGATLWALNSSLVYSEHRLSSDDEVSAKRKYASLGFAAIGVACVAAGVHFWGNSADLKDRDYYDYDDVLQNAAALERNDAMGFGVAGTAFLAAGAYLWLSSPGLRGSKPAKETARQLTPHFDDRSAGFVLSGQF